MDFATVIGLLAGFGLMTWAILLNGSGLLFWNTASFVMVVGGTLASTLVNYPLSDVLSVFATLKNAFVHRETSPAELIERLVQFAGIARREGVLALERVASSTGDPFIEKGVQLAVDGAEPELIKDILTTDLAFMEERHASSQSVLIAMGTFAPAFGLIGTLVGLIQMLNRLDNPSDIGRGMALALITTFYGAILANVFFLPAAGKLKVRTANEVLCKEIIIEAILSIQSGDNPRIVEQKLKSFVSPSIRETIKMRH